MKTQGEWHTEDRELMRQPESKREACNIFPHSPQMEPTLLVS